MQIDQNQSVSYAQYYGSNPALPAARPDEVKALLIQLVDVEKRAPGIVVGMIADDPPDRWVVGYVIFTLI